MASSKADDLPPGLPAPCSGDDPIYGPYYPSAVYRPSEAVHVRQQNHPLPSSSGTCRNTKLTWIATSFISESPLVAKAQHGLKITFIFILILFIDSVNRVYRVQQELSIATENNGGSG